MAFVATAQQVAATVAQAISQNDGETLAGALRLDEGNSALLQQLTSGRVNLEQICGAALHEPYDEMLLEYFRFLQCLHRGSNVEGYDHCERACSCFQAVFDKDTAWSLPALHTLILSLRVVASRADRELAARGEKESKMQEAARTLQRAFQSTITDRSELAVSKKWGALGVINTLFKIYFQIHNLRLCQNLIRAVESPAFPKALDGQTVARRKFPIAQLVTYKYFVGRLSLLNSDVARAERELAFAFERCPARAFKNKRLILRYLVPVRMALGVFASAALLRKYDLPYFVPLCRAVHRGDLREFEQQLAANQMRFIQHGSYLLVERSKMIAYRNFFRKVYELCERSNKLDLRRFKACLGVAGVAMDVDEIECVLANLIYSGYIKGYISHQHAKLVVAKDNAFPPLRDVLGEQ